MRRHQAQNKNDLIFLVAKKVKVNIIYATYADMAELVDALVSGTSGSNALEVRVFLSAPYFAKGFVWQVIYIWGCSSVDRALRSHRRGRGFESHQLHQDKYSNCFVGIFLFSIVGHVIMGLQLLNYKSQYCCLGISKYDFITEYI